MKTIRKTVHLLAGIVLCCGCTGSYLDINTNPAEVGQEELGRDGYAISANLRGMQNNVVSTDVNRCHRTDILLGGAYGRYAAESKANDWNEKFSTFNAPDDWSNVMFNEVIPEIYPYYTALQGVTEDPVILSVADILKVAALHRVTDTYGPIPYSRIGVDGAVQVAYDSQEEVYRRMFAELDAAVDVLTENIDGVLIRDADLIFGGDLKKWVRLANSLKLRLAMRVVYTGFTAADGRTPRQIAEESVAHPIGTMSSNADNAALATFGADGNPINTAVKYNDGDNRAPADMTAYMNAYDDPRRSCYFEESKFGAGTYEGLRSGITIGGVSTFSDYSIFRMNEKTPLQWMNAAEVMFLRAEGALRGWNMGGSARSFYERGVALSFEQWGAGDAAEYLANATGFPAGYTDPANRYSYNARLTDVTVAWDPADEGDTERCLERIIIQKWLANFPLGHEAWCDRRRTGYPKMIPVAVNLSPNGILSDSDIPRRCPYPADEAVNNAANYAAALRMLGGADNLATRVWWDCKP